MKIKTRYIILSLIGVILLVVPGMLFAVEPVAVKQPITMKGLYFSKTPQHVPLTPPPELKDLPPTPAPLTPQVRNRAINQIRGVVGLSPLIPATPTAPVVPPRVFLTPDKPKSGRSYYILVLGHNYPDPSLWTGNIGQVLPFSYGASASSSYLTFVFDTIPGKMYMIDLFMQPERVFTLSGVFTGDVTPQGAHILVAFTANSTSSSLKVKAKTPPYTVPFFFWQCELTQVN